MNKINKGLLSFMEASNLPRWLKVIKIPMYLYRNILCVYNTLRFIKHKCHLPYYSTAPCFFLIIYWRLLYISIWKGCLLFFSSCIIFHCMGVVRKNCEYAMGTKDYWLSYLVCFSRLSVPFIVFELFYNSLNYRKLMVLQIIFDHRNTSGFCPVECNWMFPKDSDMYL